MRPLELVLVLVNLLTFGVLVVPQLHAVRWTGYVALIVHFITAQRRETFPQERLRSVRSSRGLAAAAGLIGIRCVQRCPVPILPPAPDVPGQDRGPVIGGWSLQVGQEAPRLLFAVFHE
jgi:hypothetical protein